MMTWFCCRGNRGEETEYAKLSGRLQLAIGGEIVQGAGQHCGILLLLTQRIKA